MEINVYSASRRAERVQNIPAAVYVLTGEDLRRARVLSIPDALRLIPGVQVAQIDNSRRGVGIRGFIGGLGGSGEARYANKLLVLLDGRSIYDPLFAGVVWEARDVVMADVDRIEVIRGPGGALWGANAVNGVINIITKHARDSQGGLVEAGGGSEERAFGTMRYGWQTGPEQYARVYARSFDRETGFAPTGNAYDALHSERAGFRWDLGPEASDKVRISGDVFRAGAGQRTSTSVIDDQEHSGGNLLSRWEHKLSATQNVSVQFYYDHNALRVRTLDQKRDIYDLEVQHGSAPREDHQLVMGLGYRGSRDDVTGAIDPARRTDETFSAFAQDTIAFISDRLHITLGTKFEHNDYSKEEWQPSLRLAWTPNEREAWWAAASRAVRIPSRLEADLVSGGTQIGDGMVPEKVYAYELGYRRLSTTNFWWDVAAFYNQYRDLATRDSAVPPTVLHNEMRGTAYGAEFAVRWQLLSTWRLDLAYTYLEMDLEAPSGLAISPQEIEQSNPRNQFSLRSALDLSRDVQFDTTVRAVDELPALNVPAYITLDLGLSWFPRSQLELALVGRNLLDDHHPEQRLVANGPGTEVQRSYYAKATWRF